eukprot:4781688-Pyramimonas_sp.AAC.1
MKPAWTANNEFLQYTRCNLGGTINVVQSRWCSPCGAIVVVQRKCEAMHSNAIQYKAMMQRNAMHSHAAQCKTMPRKRTAVRNNATQCNATQCEAAQCKTMQRSAVQEKPMQRHAELCKAMKSHAKPRKATQND